MRVINLTPHDVVVWLENGKKVTFPKSGEVARVVEQVEQEGKVIGIPIVSKTYTEIQSLPTQFPGTIYLVSILVLQNVEGRPDVFSPDTGPGGAVRDDTGKIIGVKRFQCKEEDE